MTESQSTARTIARPTITQADSIAAIRRFGRFYTRQLGLLGEGLLQSDFSLTEARVLYELAHRPAPTAAELSRDLALDAGYLSRILKAFDQRGLTTPDRCPRMTRARPFSPSPRPERQPSRPWIGPRNGTFRR